MSLKRPAASLNKKTMINKIVKLLTLPLIKNPPSTNFSINFLTIFAYLF